MKLKISFPALVVWHTLKWTLNTHFICSVRSTCPQRYLVILWVKSGGIRWSESVMGMTGFSHEAFWPMAECTYYWIRGIPVIDQGRGGGRGRGRGRESAHKSVHGCQVEFSQLGYFLKRREGVPRLTDTTVPCWLEPRRPSRIIKLF